MASMALNSALMASNFLDGRRHMCACTGAPCVVMWCSTPCLGCSLEKVGVMSSGYSARSCRNSLVVAMVSRCDAVVGEEMVETKAKVAASMTLEVDQERVDAQEIHSKNWLGNVSENEFPQETLRSDL